MRNLASTIIQTSIPSFVCRWGLEINPFFLQTASDSGILGLRVLSSHRQTGSIQQRTLL
jgi:hypothetical protein